jgi:hypothetical protein
MKKLIVAVTCGILSSGSLPVLANPTGVTMQGDVRIVGPGNGLVFPDMSVQATATVKGPQGDAGPANALSIGTVSTGASGSAAAASITGASPNQILNLVLPQGPQGPAGPASLAALNLVACTAFDGSPSRLSVSVAADGTVSFKCPIAPKLVFVTSQAYSGNLGGLAGADGKCQALASAAGLGGIYKAWLSDSTSSPATRFTQYPHNYSQVDGTVVAADWASLTSGALLSPIVHDETGQVATIVGSGGTGPGGAILFGDCAVWNNTKANGTALLPNTGPATAVYCNDWSDATPSFVGDSSLYGAFSSQCGATACSALHPLYCFEQ